jgi:hypothetical protein
MADGYMGPACEIHAGSGYWSQDSSVKILSSTVAPKQIWARWPGGKTNVATLSAGIREIILDYKSAR